MLLGLGLGAALELLITNQPRTEVRDTIQTSYNTIIKRVTLDGLGRPHLKFVLGDTPTLLMVDTGNPISHISLTKIIADRMNIIRYPKHGDGFIIPVTLPGVGYLHLH